MLNTFKIESGRGAYEETGNRLEEEFLGTLQSSKYNELAYTHIYGNEADKENDPSKKFEKILQARAEAAKVFADTLAMSDRDKYIDFKNSMRLVEASQVGDPENPNKFFAKELHTAIKNNFVDDKYTLKFFTAAGGSHLDVKHKIDCFFKLYSKETGEELALATIDLTSNPSKQDCRADVLINISNEDKQKLDKSPNNENFDKEFLKEKITMFAKQITDALVENYKNR